MPYAELLLSAISHFDELLKPVHNWYGHVHRISPTFRCPSTPYIDLKHGKTSAQHSSKEPQRPYTKSRVHVGGCVTSKATSLQKVYRV